MADIDNINFTQNGVTTSYSIKDTEGRELISAINNSLNSLCAELGNNSNLYDAINAVIPRWKVCN